jgi:Zn-dependent metalloprotease
MKLRIVALAALAAWAWTSVGSEEGALAAGRELERAAATAPGLDRKAKAALDRLGGGTEEIVVRWHEKPATPALLDGTIAGPSAHSPEWIAYTFLDNAKELYGIAKPRRDMQVADVRRFPDGGSEVRFRHLLYGTPVRGDELVVRIGSDGSISRVEGRVYPRLEKATFHRRIHAALTPTEAAAVATTFAEAVGVPPLRPQVALYYEPTQRGTPLVYAVSFGGDGVEAVVLVHALTGRVIP